MQVDADRGCPFEKILAVGIAPGNENRNRAFDTRASAQLNSRMDAGWCPEKSLAQVSAPPLRLGLTSRNADARNHCRDCAAAHPSVLRAHSCEEAVEHQKYINTAASAQCTGWDYSALSLLEPVITTARRFMVSSLSPGGQLVEIVDRCVSRRFRPRCTGPQHPRRLHSCVSRGIQFGFHIRHKQDPCGINT